MDGQAQEVAEQPEEIKELLSEIIQGDELTVESGGYKDNRTVKYIDHDKNIATFGPIEDSSRVIDIETGKIAAIPHYPGKLPNWKEIDKVIKW